MASSDDEGPTRSARSAGDPTHPSPARIYDYWLGGKDHFAVDRSVGDRVLATAPWAAAGARASRAYLGDSVRWLTAQGIDQFIDLGSGLPTAGNVHEIAQALDPRAKVVYVDNDPVVLTYARALLVDDDRVIVLEGDVRRAEQVMEALRLNAFLDLDRPVAVLFSAIMHFVPDAAGPAKIVETVLDAVAPGSYILISQVVADDDELGRQTREAAAQYSAMAEPFITRTTAEIRALFEGLDVVDPPGVHVLRLHGQPSTVAGGMARKP
jgi:SAM-dependent methyltransferase